MKFAKLFEVDKTQVLVTAQYDTDDEQYKLMQTTEHKGVRASISFCFDKKRLHDKAFKEYDQQKAEEFHKSVVTTLETY